MVINRYMNKLFFVLVNTLVLVSLLTSGCNTTQSSAQEKGWLEVKPAKTGDSGLINPDDYK